MRLLKLLVVATILTFAISPTTAKPNTGGGNTEDCKACNKLVGESWVEYRCVTGVVAGRKNCQITRNPYGCQESGDYCGWFFPSPNPIIM